MSSGPVNSSPASAMSSWQSMANDHDKLKANQNEYLEPQMSFSPEQAARFKELKKLNDERPLTQDEFAEFKDLKEIEKRHREVLLWNGAQSK